MVWSTESDLYRLLNTHLKVPTFEPFFVVAEPGKLEDKIAAILGRLYSKGFSRRLTLRRTPERLFGENLKELMISEAVSIPEEIRTVQKLDLSAGVEVLKGILKAISSLKASLEAKGTKTVEASFGETSRYLIPLGDLNDLVKKLSKSKAEEIKRPFRYLVFGVYVVSALTYTFKSELDTTVDAAADFLEAVKVNAKPNVKTESSSAVAISSPMFIGFEPCVWDVITKECRELNIFEDIAISL